MALRVVMDPRVTTSTDALQTQFDLSMRIKAVLDRRDQSPSARLRQVVGELESLYRQLQSSDQAPGLGVVSLVEQRLDMAERLLPPR
jgi:hypothetical protein